MYLGDKIKQAMKEAGIKTRKHLAELMGCHASEVSFWMTGRRGMSLENRKKMAKILDKPEDFLLELDEQINKPHPELEIINNIVFLKEIGAVRCGKFQLLIGEDGEYPTHLQTMDVLPSKAHRMSIEEIQNRYFIFYAKGDSMEPVIIEGDNLIIEKIDNNSFDNGEIILCSNSENHVVCKRIYKVQNKIILRSENTDKDKFPDIELNEPEDLTILGRVVYIGRKPLKKKIYF